MELKLFGSAQERCKGDLDLLVSLPDRELKTISRWVSDTPNLFPVTWRDFEGLHEVSLNPQEIDRVLGVLRFVIDNWKTQDISLKEVRSNLSAIGYAGKPLEKLIRFFSTLENFKSKVHDSLLKNVYEKIGLPTVDDLNILWDFRPVFEELVYTTGPQSDRYETLSGGVYLLLLEISASRADGKQETQTYQFNERDFDRFLVSLTRAKRQLEVLKKETVTT